jgi:transcriptional regulator with GAF, ATPase, and Fis domain
MVSPQLSGAGEGTFEVMLNRKDGRTYTVEIVSRDIMYRGKEARMDRVRDITEKRKAQEDKEALMKQLDSVSEELSELNQIATIAVHASSPQQALDTLLRNLAQVTRAESAMVMGRRGETLTGRAIYGFEGTVPVDLVANIGDEFPGSIVKEDRWVFVEDARADAVMSPLKEAGASSLLGVPIRQGSDIIGALYVAWKDPRHLAEGDTKMMEMVADRCASALITSDLSERDKADEEMGRSLSEITSTLSSALKFSDPSQRSV